MLMLLRVPSCTLLSPAAAHAVGGGHGSHTDAAWRAGQALSQELGCPLTQKLTEVTAVGEILGQTWVLFRLCVLWLSLEASVSNEVMSCVRLLFPGLAT